MDLSTELYLGLLAGVALARVAELRVSRRRAAELARLGAQPAGDPVFPWMVLLHASVLVGAAVEVVALRRAWVPALGVPMMGLVVLATALRWWVIHTLGAHWNVRVIDSTALGVVSHGPYRWVRHPNYLAVLVELLALPLVHGAWITALVGGLLHAGVIRWRIAAEEAVLLADPAYRAVMGPKPRLLPFMGRRYLM